MGMTDAIDLTVEQRNQLTTLLRRFLPGVAVWAYGSRVKWTARPNSDLDLVAFTTPAQRSQVADLKDALAESNLPFPVDLHVWDDVPERFREIIQKEYVVVQEAKEPDSKKGLVDEWKQTTLGAIATQDGYGLVDGPFGSNLPASCYTDSGVPVIRGSNLTVGTSRFVTDEFVFVSRKTADSLARSLCRPNDVVFTKKGTLGQTGLVPERGPYDEYLLSSNQMKLTVDRKLADPLFVYYYVSSPESMDKIVRDSAVTGVPKTNVAYLRDFQISLPPLSEQRAIAHILGTLDDKIELNRRMNETLEAMARTLFKSWFVDFDPVRAKAEGRDTGLPKHLVDLFPDSFEDSELGEIPRGWSTGSLGDFSFLNPESWSRDTWPEVIKYVDLANAKWGRIEVLATYAKKDAPSRAQRVLRVGDTIVGTVRPGNGSYAFVTEEGLTGSTGFAVLRPRKLEYREFVYLAATVGENIDALAHLADGGAYPAVRPEVVISTLTVHPTDQVVAHFARTTSPFLARMAQNERESRTLVVLRDTLLPKLISGELRVPASTVERIGQA